MHVIEVKLKRSRFIAAPHSSFKFAWDIILILITLYIAIYIPVKISFDLRRYVPVYISIIVEFILIADIIVSMNSGF
jgi:uncharacterized membrane protein YesL